MTTTAAQRLPILIRARLLQMMSSLERVGVTPIEGKALHAFAYFANVLSPLWDLQPLEDSVIKEADSPYFPSLQRQIDSLVGTGLIKVSALTSIKEDGHQRLEASFFLDLARAQPVLLVLNNLPDESRTDEFLIELADAFARIRPDRRDEAAEVDASYSDPAIADGRFVNFKFDGHTRFETPSLAVADSFQKYAPEHVTLTNAQKLVMYMHLMKRRAHG